MNENIIKSLDDCVQTLCIMQTRILEEESNANELLQHCVEFAQKIADIVGDYLIGTELEPRNILRRIDRLNTKKRKDWELEPNRSAQPNYRSTGYKGERSAVIGSIVGNAGKGNSLEQYESAVKVVANANNVMDTDLKEFKVEREQGSTIFSRVGAGLIGVSLLRKLQTLAHGEPKFTQRAVALSIGNKVRVCMDQEDIDGKASVLGDFGDVIFCRHVWENLPK